jgi:AcrR family transcriptional regulator
VPKKRSLTKDDWVRAAMELLRTRGIGGVRVLPLAKQLRVSRGSFYWHFESHSDLLDSMLDWWDREMTDVVIDHANAARGSAKKRLLLAVGDIVGNDLSRYDSAIRSWAQGDKKAMKALRRVIRKRLDYISGVFEEAGFPLREARARGDLLAVYLMSEAAIHIEESLETRLRLVRRQVRFLTS